MRCGLNKVKLKGENKIMLFKSKDKIDALTDEQNKKISKKAKLEAKKKAQVNKLEIKREQIENKIAETNRIIDYKVDCLEFEIEELGNMIALKAHTNAKKKSLEISTKVPEPNEKEKEIIEKAVKRCKNNNE